jgi:hypothetical protein
MKIYYLIICWLHFLNADYLLKADILLVGFIWPENILVIDEDELFGVDTALVEFGSRFYSSDFKLVLPSPVTVLGLFSFYTFTIEISFLAISLLESFGILKLVLLSTVIVFDFESFLPSSLYVLFFFNIKAYFCLIFYYSAKNILFRWAIFYIWQKSIYESLIFWETYLAN